MSTREHAQSPLASRVPWPRMEQECPDDPLNLPLPTGRKSFSLVDRASHVGKRVNVPGGPFHGQFPLWTERREPWLEQHEAQQEGFGVRGSGRFTLGGPASGQDHSTGASWLGRAWFPTRKASRSTTLTWQNSCGRAGWLALRLGAGRVAPAGPLPHTQTTLPRLSKGSGAAVSRGGVFLFLFFFSRRKC